MKRPKLRDVIACPLPLFLVALGGFGGCQVLGVEAPPDRSTFRSDWSEHPDRVWVGRDHWANRLQDWRLEGGGAVCVEARPRFGVRTLHLLTHWLEDGAEGSFRTKVSISAAEGDRAGSAAGFLIGAGGQGVDPRLTSQVHGCPAEDGGYLLLVDASGSLSVVNFEERLEGGGLWSMKTNHELSAFSAVDGVQLAGDGFGAGGPRPVELEVTGAHFDGRRTVVAAVRDQISGAILSTATWDEAPRSLFDGSVALVSHRGPAGAGQGYRFEDWSLGGELVRGDEARSFGPIAFVHYAVDEVEGPGDARLELTAQSVPLGVGDTLVASLELAGEDGEFEQVATAPFVRSSATFHFAVDGIDATRETPFRVRYVPRRINAAGEGVADPAAVAVYEGVVAARPSEDAMTIAVVNCQKSFTGDLRWNEQGLWFPHAAVARHVAAQEPHLLYFAGDQIYEGDLTPAITAPIKDALLDYLHKWYRHGWSFGQLTRRLPSVVVPDDHDVYHGNVWGNAGVREPETGDLTVQDRGGYKMPPEFVNAVHRTQVEHLPAPRGEPTLEVGITTYHTTLSWGGGSFAVLADRMYKSPPAVVVTEGRVRNGWALEPEFDPARGADVEGAVLLGSSQLDMLEQWGASWPADAWFKACLSQTPFANVATIPETANSGGVIPSLKVPAPGEYVSGDKRAADMDSNGWPQSGRDAAVRLLRSAGAFHLTGDQHLGSTLRYGVDAFDDAGFVLSSPAVANTWPRRWFPDPAKREPGGAADPAAPGYTGRYLDGFGNRMTVLAVANPRAEGIEPTRLNDRAPGYGIARVDREAGAVQLEAWPRHVDPLGEGARPYGGWPVRFNLSEADGRAPAGWLPQLRLAEPTVLQVVREGEAPEVLYTRLTPAGSARLPVFDRESSYTVRASLPGREGGAPWPWSRARLRPVSPGEGASLEVALVPGNGRD
ncbi:MAG: alkaline phosphatase D family protein [Planctomycetota bacterium]|nr:alkaline phosphatase D family protein [Planctomycetota bacterium]